MYFETQQKKSHSCVLHALNNAMQGNYVTCEVFANLVDEIAANKADGNNELKKKYIDQLTDLHSHCLEPGFTQDHWSFTVALRWLKKQNIIYTSECDEKDFFHGQYLLHIVHVNKKTGSCQHHKESHHAIALVDGFLLDSLLPHAIKLTVPLIRNLQIKNAWCLHKKKSRALNDGKP